MTASDGHANLLRLLALVGLPLLLAACTGPGTPATPAPATPAASDTPLLDRARVVAFVGTPSGGVLAPERLASDLGAELVERFDEIAEDLARGRIHVLLVDDGSLEQIDADAVALAARNHAIVLGGINVTHQQLAERVLSRYPSPTVQQALADGVFGPDDPCGPAECLAILWAPNANTGSAGTLDTGFGRDGTPGIGHREAVDAAGRLETTLENREMQGWPVRSGG